MRSGTTGEVAVVDLSTSTIGDVITTPTGGVTIQSIPKAGQRPLPASSIRASTTLQSYALSWGTLTDQTTITTTC